MKNENFTREQIVRRGDKSTDPKAYMKEFDFSAAGRESPGDSTGYMRFVSFESDDKNTIMVADCHLSPHFENGMVGLFAQNDTVFQKMKRIIATAELVRNGMPPEIASIGYKIGLFDEPTGRKSDGIRGIMEQILRDANERKNRKNPIDEILDDIIGERKQRGGMSAKVFSGNIGELADLLRSITNGEGCDCPKCTAKRDAANNNAQPITPTDPTVN